MQFGLTFGLGARQGRSFNFLPSQVAGLSLWLDAADLSTITQVGGAVSQWTDKSTQGNHAVQPVSASQPMTGIRVINELNVIDFDGANDYFSLPSSLYGISTAGNHAFFVFSRDVLNVEHRGLYGLSNGGSNGWGFKLSAGSGTQQQYIHGSAFANAGSLSDTNVHILEGKRDGTGASASMDNNYFSTVAASNFTMTGLTLGCRPGGSNFLNGTVAEVLVYDRALETEERAKILNYLKSKWGTP